MSLSGPVRRAPRSPDSLALTSHHTFPLSSLLSYQREDCADMDCVGQATLARVSAILATQKEPKPTPPKKLRGKKAAAGPV